MFFATVIVLCSLKLLHVACVYLQSGGDVSSRCGDWVECDNKNLLKCRCHVCAYDNKDFLAHDGLLNCQRVQELFWRQDWSLFAEICGTCTRQLHRIPTTKPESLWNTIHSDTQVPGLLHFMNNYSSSIADYLQMMCCVSIWLRSIRTEKQELLHVAVCC